MIELTGIPHKYIEIEDLVFALPDDFEGTCQDALKLLLEYILTVMSSCKDTEVTDADDDRGIVMLQKAKTGSKVSIKFRLYEYNTETKSYEMKSIIKGSNENDADDLK